MDMFIHLVWYWNLSPATSLIETRSLATNEWSEYLVKTPGGPFEHMEADINDLRTAHAHKDQPFNPKAVWFLYLDSAPIISNAAIAVLSVSASEASVERSFSAQGMVHNDLRNRLKDHSVETEMFIKFNEAALKRKPQEVKKDKLREMDEHYEEPEDAASVKDLFRVIPDDSDPVVFPEVGEEVVEQMEAEFEEDTHEEKMSDVSAVVSRIPPPPPSSDDVQRFIVDYVARHNIHAKTRWKAHQEQQLEAEGQAFKPPMMDQTIILKRKIMAYVKGLAEREQEEEESKFNDVSVGLVPVDEEPIVVL
jgi:hypothetical protein